LKQAVLRTLSLVLALLGLVAVIMVVWGGFTWLTSGGDETKVESAKKIISAAVIGLIVVLLSWAIVLFATRTTQNVITDPNTNA
jgi:TRAP-type C4-dicarboxylate transport system permease small subunit